MGVVAEAVKRPTTVEVPGNACASGIYYTGWGDLRKGEQRRGREASAGACLGLRARIAHLTWYIYLVRPTLRPGTRHGHRTPTRTKRACGLRQALFLCQRGREHKRTAGSSAVRLWRRCSDRSASSLQESRLADG